MQGSAAARHPAGARNLAIGCTMPMRVMLVGLAQILLVIALALLSLGVIVMIFVALDHAAGVSLPLRFW